MVVVVANGVERDFAKRDAPLSTPTQVKQSPKMLLKLRLAQLSPVSRHLANILGGVTIATLFRYPHRPRGWVDYERTPACHPSHFISAYASDWQNLLRTLTASQVKSSLPESELKLLLSAVKETRVSG